MSEDWVQLMTELREQQKAERDARARIPKTVFSVTAWRRCQAGAASITPDRLPPSWRS